MTARKNQEGRKKRQRHIRMKSDDSGTHLLPCEIPPKGGGVGATSVSREGRQENHSLIVWAMKCFQVENEEGKAQSGVNATQSLDFKTAFTVS